MVVNMETPVRVTSDCEVHAIIWLFTAQGANVIQIHHKLVSMCGREVLSVQMVRQWQEKFHAGGENLHDELCSG